VQKTPLVADVEVVVEEVPVDVVVLLDPPPPEEPVSVPIPMPLLHPTMKDANSEAIRASRVTSMGHTNHARLRTAKFSATVPGMPTDTDLATSALERLVSTLAEDAMFVLAGGARDVKDALESLLQRRAAAYTAAVQGQPHTRMTGQYGAWFVDMARAMAPVSPPSNVPMMEIVREKVTLEIGARGLRSLFSSKPSDKEVARVKRYGSLAVRVLRAVLAADGSLDDEERTLAAALVASLGLPEADANALYSEPAMAPESLEVYGEVDPAIVRAVLRGAWLAAAQDALDPREEQAIRTIAQKLGLSAEDVESARRDALARVEARYKAGAAAVDGVRFVLGDRLPGLGVKLAAKAGALMLPRRWREEVLAPVAQGAPVTLAERHIGLESDERHAVLGVTWAAALADDPSVGRLALLRARWERFADDMGEDSPSSREVVERWLGEALAGAARTLK
jgi:tellurite resistance protein